MIYIAKIILTISLLSLVKSSLAPILFVPDYGVATIEVTGDYKYLFLIIDIRENDLSNDLTFKLNTPNRLTKSDIGVDMSYSDVLEKTYEELMHQSYDYNDIFFDFSSTHNSNSTYTYTMEQEMISSLDNYMVVKVPISKNVGSSSIIIKAWVDHGLSAGAIVAIVLCSVFCPLIIAAIISLCVCYHCPCCPWYIHNHKQFIIPTQPISNLVPDTTYSNAGQSQPPVYTTTPLYVPSQGAMGYPQPQPQVIYPQGQPVVYAQPQPPMYVPGTQPGYIPSQ